MSLTLGGSSGGGSGNVVSDPKLLTVGRYQSISFIFGVTQSINLDLADSKNKIVVENGGSFVDVVSANTWETICDITGRGVVGNIISPLVGINIPIEFEITVDGETTVITALSADSGNGRAMLGVSMADTYYNGVYKTLGFTKYTYGMLSRASEHMKVGLVLGFNESIKVRVRCPIVPQSYQNRKTAFVTHSIY